MPGQATIFARVALLAAALTVPAPTPAADAGRELRFAWPASGSALVELDDERRVGDTLRSSAVSMRLDVTSDGPDGRLLLRFSDRRVLAGDQRPIEVADPESLGVAVARVLQRATPAFVVSVAGGFVEGRELDTTLREVIEACGFPAMPPGARAFRDLLEDLAAEDWNAWVGMWRGEQPAPGAWTTTETDGSFHGQPVRIRLTRRGLAPPDNPRRIRLQAVAVYPSEAVRHYTAGLLLDLAREAKELGDDPVVNTRFLDRAKYSPMTETLTAELEAATMRPIVIERERTFSAVAGRHWVDGSERRVHRFKWDAVDHD